jgi:hypothetical protein
LFKYALSVPLGTAAPTEKLTSLCESSLSWANATVETSVNNMVKRIFLLMLHDSMRRAAADLYQYVGIFKGKDRY